MAKFINEKAFTTKKLKDVFVKINEGIKMQPFLFTMVLLTTIVDAILSSMIPKIAQEMANSLLNPGTEGVFGLKLSWHLWMIIGLFNFAMIIVFEYLANWTGFIFSKKMEIHFRTKALIKLAREDISYYFNNKIGLLMSRIITDSEGVGNGFIDFLINSIYFITTLGASVYIIFSIDVPVASIITGIFFILFILVWIFFVYLRREILRSVDLKQENDADMTDRVMNIRLVKSSGTESHEIHRGKKLQKKYNKSLTKIVGLQSSLTLFSVSFATIFPPLSIILGIYLNGGDNIENMNLLIPKITGLLSASYQLLLGIVILPQTMRGLTKLGNCVMRLNRIYDAPELIERNEINGLQIKSIENIEFNNVVFAYPDQPNQIVLPSTSIKLEKSKSYAFVGETGSGKSTIAKLLLRFYDPIKGNIKINGNDLKKLNLPNYLEKVGYVEQEPQILYGTVEENIMYGSFSATKEQVVEAAKKAKIHDFIMSNLDKGYDSILGERGFMLSGGQKQRIVIARLFLKNPDLIILDEATSALDNIVEKEIQEELDKLIEGRTTVVIAHRLSTIKNVDYVVVLDRNKGIDQIGTFNELKSIPGRFKNLYDAGDMG